MYPTNLESIIGPASPQSRSEGIRPAKGATPPDAPLELCPTSDLARSAPTLESGGLGCNAAFRKGWSKLGP